MAKAKPEVYSGSILGINQEGEVVSLSVYRKGGSVRLSRMFSNGTTYDHSMALPGRTAKSEAVVVFNLHDIVEIAQVMDGGAAARKIRAELEEKAKVYRENLAKAKEGEVPE
ncbi:hypothetical protein ACQR16_34400 [Bradyrhizobium oligotrophicum]|uniref:hypothetical protein n=1 Tax=Bradyrhizobium oligotrophicum TaxID=44255 RepID=UPI003EBF0E87